MFNRGDLFRQRGFTLIEVLVAVSVIAIISVLAVQSISSANDANEVTQRKLKEIQRMDRFWRFIEMDMRNVLAYPVISPLGGVLLPMEINDNDQYFLKQLRGGVANPLMLQRSELSRVAYRLEDNVIWRDSWTNIASEDEEEAFQQKLLAGVEEVVLEALQPTAQDIDDRNWSEAWPIIGATDTDSMPLAVKVNIFFEDERELQRLFILPAGK